MVRAVLALVDEARADRVLVQLRVLDTVVGVGQGVVLAVAQDADLFHDPLRPGHAHVRIFSRSIDIFVFEQNHLLSPK